MAHRIEVQAHGSVAVGAVTWRYRGQARLTVVVKAAFDPTGTPRPAEALRSMGASSYGRWGTDGLLHAGDRVPFRPAVDVIVARDALSSRGRAADPVAVGVRIARAGRPVLDKQLAPIGEADIGAWLGSTAAPLLSPEPISLPDDFDWRSMHLAPWDQRLPALEGSERVEIGWAGAIARGELLLPMVRAVAALVGSDGRPVGEPFGLVADTLEIALDGSQCAMGWRGSVELVAADESRVVFGWLEPIATAQRSEAAPAELGAAPAARRASRLADDHDEVTRVARPLVRGPTVARGPVAPSPSPHRPDAAAAAAMPSSPVEQERAPDSSRTRPMLPIDHLLAVGRKTVPYEEPAPARPPGSAAEGERAPVVDVGAWVAERLPRGAALPTVHLAIGQAGPTLDDAPELSGPLPPIIMPAPRRRDSAAELYDDEVTALRPLGPVLDNAEDESPESIELEPDDDPGPVR